MTDPQQTLAERAAAIKMVVLDVDGVMTDGKITYTASGDEIKAFNVKDGLGISKAIRDGLEIGIITARESAIVTRRAAELGIIYVKQNTKTKLPALEALRDELKLGWHQVAYMGDDLPDIPCLEAVGLSACPADAAREVLGICDLVSTKKGGEGAVRDFLEFLQDARDGVANPQVNIS